MAGKALLGGGTSGRTPRAQPKQTKISSSVFRQQRSPVTQKIPKTTPLGGYGFTGGGRIPKNVFLMPQVSAGGSDESVRDILFDIKRLLTADFKYRINKEQQEIDAIRKFFNDAINRNIFYIRLHQLLVCE